MPNETISPSLHGDFCALAAEFLAEGDPRYQEATTDLKGFIQRCAEETIGRNLLPGRVPQSTFWLVHDGQKIWLFPIASYSQRAF